MWPDRFSIPMAMAHPIRVSQMACWIMTERLLSSSRHSLLKIIHYLLSPNLHYVENGITMLFLELKPESSPGLVPLHYLAQNPALSM